MVKFSIDPIYGSYLGKISTDSTSITWTWKMYRTTRPLPGYRSRHTAQPSFLSSFWAISPGSHSGLRQLVEEVVHDADDIGLVGTEDVVVGVRQTDHLS